MQGSRPGQGDGGGAPVRGSWADEIGATVQRGRDRRGGRRHRN